MRVTLTMRKFHTEIILKIAQDKVTTDMTVKQA